MSNNWNSVLRGPGRLKQSLADSSFDAWTKYYQADENTPNAVVSYYGLTFDGIAEQGLDRLLEKLLGSGFQKIWGDFKSRYVYGTEDIPLQKWILSKVVSVSLKAQTKLEKIKLQLGLRHSDANGWLKITHVLDGGAAQEAGLAPGDLLASMNGQRITSGRWDKVLNSLTENQNISICFYRDDLEHERILVLRPTQLPVQYDLSPASALNSPTGLSE